MIENIKSVNKDWKLYLAFSVVFAFTMSFVNDIDTYYAIVFILLFDLVLIRKRISFDIGDLILTVATLSYGIIWDSDASVIILNIIRMIVLYQVAKYLADPAVRDNTPSVSDASGYTALTSALLALMLFLKGLFNYSYILYEHSLLEIGMWPTRNVYWSLEDMINLETKVFTHSQHQFYIVLMGSMLLFFVLLVRKNKIIGSAGIILSAAAVCIGTLTKGKLAFICSAVAVMISLVVLAVEKEWVRKRAFWIIFMLIATVVTAFAMILKFNLFDLYDLFGEKIWSYADGVYYSDRFSMMRQAVTLLRDYPMGGYNDMLVEASVETGPYACNSWLLIGVNAGIIPVILYLGFLIVNTITLVFIIRKCSGIYKYALISAFVGMTTYHMLESAFIADFRFWNTEIFLGGMVYGLYACISGKRGIVISADMITDRLMRMKNARKV